MTNEILDMALRYAEIGIPVMPLHGIKEDDACTCKKGGSCSIKGKHPIFNGWLVLDVDTKYQGDESLEVLEMLYDELPPTVTAITGSGGKHIIFKYPKGMYTLIR